jgi:hypothetical protein
VISIIRLTQIFAFLTTTDFTWLTTTTQTWTMLELNISIICACMPCAKPLLKRHLPALLGLTSTHKSGGHGHCSKNSTSRASKHGSRACNTEHDTDDLELCEGGGRYETRVEHRQVNPTDSRRYTDGGDRPDVVDSNIYKTTDVQVDYWQQSDSDAKRCRNDDDLSEISAHNATSVKNKENL